MPTVSGMNLENSKRAVCNTESRNFIRIQVPRSHNLPSEVGTSRVESSEASSQTPATVVTMPDSSENVQKLFFTLCDKLFTDVVNFKIPKIAYDLYLLISYDVMKEERFKKINQLLSSETVVSEKHRAEKEFADMIKIRAQSFVPLFMTIVNRIDSDNLKALLTAVYCRIVQKLETIDPITSAYRFKIRSIIKTMLEKHGCKQPEILAYFDTENDTNFLTNFCFIENLLKKYDTEPREVGTTLRIQPNTEMTASSTSTERDNHADSSVLNQTEKNPAQSTPDCSVPQNPVQSTPDCSVPQNPVQSTPVCSVSQIPVQSTPVDSVPQNPVQSTPVCSVPQIPVQSTPVCSVPPSGSGMGSFQTNKPTQLPPSIGNLDDEFLKNLTRKH
ncbi:uncharacterized protein LOC128997163 [Macrosteles quadrilineatus]|uniref:uncharacterized protein LOC128997163 n=1 Tax=Macrosteles quadrilineatus TaxID=74068 RepID=UPI0023E09EC1|nr:uncharacterized protein LOC128997163 [Macrosteles quadrilineatus]